MLAVSQPSFAWLPVDVVAILRPILAASLALCLCFGNVAVQAQAAAKETTAKDAASKAVAIVFENVLKQSKIHFTLKNSISPHRYSIETMTG
jgi:hypothetical protein